MRLPERQRLILKEIVDRYIRQREPVSSRMILEDYGLSVSSATVRNDMNDLESEGYIEKPHSSSGRVPTKKGYRFFVDWLLDLSELTKKERMEIVEAYRMRCLEVGEAMRQTAFLLGNITGYAGFVIPPQWGKTRLDRVILVRSAPNQVLFVVVSDIGVVEHGLIPLDNDLLQEELNNVMETINSNLRGVSLDEVRELTMDEGPEGWYDQMAQEALVVLRHLLERRMHRHLYLEGTTNLAADLEEILIDGAMKQFVGLIEIVQDEEVFSKMIRDSRRGEEGLNVSVGDCSVAELSDFAVVTSDYGPYSGLLGVIGPLWMDYGKALSVTSYVASRLEVLLSASCAQPLGGNRDEG